MEVNIELISQKLKAFVAQFDTKMFFGDMGMLVQHISFENQIKPLEGLSSPLRQLQYLAALNITSDPGAVKVEKYTNDDWAYIKKLLLEIEEGYELFFYPKPDDVRDEAWKERRRIAMPSFLNYFNQGTLNYEEQEIERISTYFQPLNAQIFQHFGLEVTDFIDIYNHIDSLVQTFMDQNINAKVGDVSWADFASSMIEQGIPPWEWQPHLPDRFKKMFEFIHDSGQMFRFKKTQLYQVFNPDKVDSFLAIFTLPRRHTSFLYYTEMNPLMLAPICQIDDDTFQYIQGKQIIHAVYGKLFEFCLTIPPSGERIKAIRGDKFEEKIESLFRDFFKNKATIYRGYYSQDGSEQDILILINRLALVIEAKSSKRTEPRRDPDKAYPLILSNFNEVIQKGYDQAYRIKGKFIDKEVLHIYSDQKLTKHLYSLRTKNYDYCYSIIVTLEQFGQMQTNLEELLEIYDDDEYPWSITLDDLEIFLLYLKKKQFSLLRFIQFLELRQKVHGKSICSDELEICGWLLTDKSAREKLKLNKDIIFTPSLSNIFDDEYLYHGLGLKDEKNLTRKTSARSRVYGRE